MSEKKKNKAAQQEAVTEETASAAQAGAPEQEGQPAAPAEDSTQAVQAALAEKEDQYLRLAAEYDNYRKRTAKEKEAIYPEAKANTIAAVLPVLDSFERAMEAPCSDEDFKRGLELIRKAFDEVLQKQGVEAFGQVGEEFDPNQHSAVAHQEDDSVGENCIAEVFQKGYRMGDRILRYAMVKVAN